MDFNGMLNQFITGIPHLVEAILLLIVGWIIARILGSFVTSGIKRSALDKRLVQATMGEGQAQQVEVASLIGTGVFYVIMVFVVIAVLELLGLTAVSQPLNTLLEKIVGFLPNILAAVLLLVLAWILATILKIIVHKGLMMANLDQRVGQQGGTSLSKTLSEVVFYLVFLFFLPSILSALALDAVLAPVLSLVNILLDFLPHLFSAAVILVVGIFVANLVRRIVTDLLTAAGTDRLAERTGIAPALAGTSLAATIGLIVYVLILIPVITASLDALQLSSVTQPISTMLATILNAIPHIFAAVLLFAIAWVIGRVLGTLASSILTGAGFNTVPKLLGIGREPAAGERTPSEVVGTLVHIAIALFAAIEALDLMGFSQVADLITGVTTLGGHILLGIIIFAIGLYLSRLAADAVRASSVPNPGLLALVAQVAILILVGAMALKQAGIADQIVNLAFGLIIGAIAVAAAIAFGIGGRDVAGRELDRFVTNARAEQPKQQ